MKKLIAQSSKSNNLFLSYRIHQLWIGIFYFTYFSINVVVVKIEVSEFISKSNSCLKNAMSLWPSSDAINIPITGRVPITDRVIPITDHVPIIDRNPFWGLFLPKNLAKDIFTLKKKNLPDALVWRFTFLLSPMVCPWTGAGVNPVNCQLKFLYQIGLEKRSVQYIDPTYFFPRRIKALYKLKNKKNHKKSCLALMLTFILTLTFL